jgi:toxin FitB
MYLVDTNVISEARRGTAAARNWLRSVDPAAVYLSVITIGEIMKGIAMKQRNDPVQGAALTVWLERLRQEHASVSFRSMIAWLSNGGALPPCGRAAWRMV